MTKRMAILFAGLVGGLGVATLVPAQAADYKSVMTGEPTAQELIDALSPSPELKTRGIRPKDAGETTPAPEVNLPMITFEFDSADLTPQARRVLDQLAAALESQQLGSDRFLIEGYTDTVGSADYNLGLSKRRADAVSRYLAGRQVNTGRLEVVGKGEADPIDPDGTAAVNRRVRVVNLGGE